MRLILQLRMKPNNHFKMIINKLNRISKEGDVINLDKSFALTALLPKRLGSFFTYNGSLSSPPCSEVVTWFVFPDSIPISFEQVGFRDYAYKRVEHRVEKIGRLWLFKKISCQKKVNLFFRSKVFESYRSEIIFEVCNL